MHNFALHKIVWREIATIKMGETARTHTHAIVIYRISTGCLLLIGTEQARMHVTREMCFIGTRAMHQSLLLMII